MIKLFNTFSGTKEPLIPVSEGKIGIYACGPTVYDYFHIGNARVFITIDVLRRYLSYRGYQVTFVQNYTDIDDKMIGRAKEMDITVQDLADRFIDHYLEDADSLGILPADYQPRATEHIPQIITLIEQLLEKGMAYEVEGDVYFDVQSFPSYGKLSGQNLSELASGSRVEVDERKKHPVDFVLWKKEKPGEPSWESPWGRGRPGWHIECSAMSTHYLGDTLDIHAGGQDLIFPHHENEIAQSEGATGKTFVKYWTHVGYLNINEEKMSKSLGNVLTVRQLRQEGDPLALRFFMLSAHYRSPINFTLEYLAQTSKALERLNSLVYNIRQRAAKAVDGTPDNEEEILLQKVQSSWDKFMQSMDDDFNTAEAIGSLFELAREANIYLNRAGGQKIKVLEEILQFYQKTDQILGYLRDTAPLALDEEIEELLQKREEARRRKDWAVADEIRDRLKESGIILEDTPQGVRWKREK